MDGNGTKRLMAGYEGVKFRAVQQGGQPRSVKCLYGRFQRICGSLREHGMTPANGGNISMAHESGFVITAAGSNLGMLEMEELVFVGRCSLDDRAVFYRGRTEPSSETLMHWLIYQEHRSARAIIHAHDDGVATRSGLLAGRLAETAFEEPYGTVALARRALEAFDRAERIIVLKNHGYVAIGSDLDEAGDLVIATHLDLLALRQASAQA